MTDSSSTIQDMIQALVGSPKSTTRIIITVEPTGAYSISVKGKKVSLVQPFRRVDPATRRIIRELGDPKYGPINQPNYKGPRVGDPVDTSWLNEVPEPAPKPSDWLSSDPTPTRDPGGTP